MSAPPSPAQHRAAVALVIGAVALFAAFDATVKLLGQVAPLVMVLWARYAFQTVVTAVSAWPRHGLSLLATRQPMLQVLRGLSLLSMSALAFLSLRQMPVGEFTAIVMLTPLLVTVQAALMLGERVSRLRWLLMLAGLACALLVIRPQHAHRGGGLPLAMLLPALLVVAGAAFHTLSSRLARSEDASTTHLYTGAVGTLLLSLLLPWHWQALPWSTWALMGLAAALSSSGHFLLILAYMRAKAAVLTPYLYLQIAFATLAGVVLFRHVPDVPALLGIAGVAFCGALGTWLTAHEARPARPASA